MLASRMRRAASALSSAAAAPDGPLEVLGSENIVVSDANSASGGVTIPANCSFAVVSVIAYEGGSTTEILPETAEDVVRIGGAAMTKRVHIGGDDGTDVIQLGMYTLADPPTGSQTVSVGLNAPAPPLFAGANWEILYLRNVDLADPVVSEDAAPNYIVTGAPSPLSVTAGANDLTLHLIGAVEVVDPSHAATSIVAAIRNGAGVTWSYAFGETAPGHDNSSTYECHCALVVRSAE